MLIQHIRYAARLLARTPGITAAAILCLALGIGATSAIFSVVNAVLLRPLPYVESNRLVRIFTEFPKFPNGGLRRFWMSSPELLDLRRETKSWDAIEAWQIGSATLAGGNDAVRAVEAYVTGGALPLMGIAPVLGRTLNARDDTPGAPLVAVLSYGLWQRAYGGDPAILGRDVRLDGQSCRVVGVMPDRFEFPPAEIDKAEIWVPAQIDPARPGGRGSHGWSVVGRLKSGTSLAQANQELALFVERSAQNNTPSNHDFSPDSHPLVTVGFQEEVIGGARLAMLVLMGAVVFVLMIASVNVANLLLARAESRRREIAVRKAIGAGLSTLLGQFVIEGLMLSFFGALFGLAFAYGGLTLIVRANPGSLPRASEISLDATVLLFTLAVSCLTGVVFGFAPVMHLVGQNLHETLKAAAGRTTAGVAGKHFRGALVAVELALALMLLIGAGLLVKTFWRLQNVDAGFQPDHVLTALITLPEAAYNQPGANRHFFENLEERLARLPGVKSVAAASGLAPLRPINANDTRIEGFVDRPGGPLQNMDYWNIVDGRYFETLRVRLVDGRFFDSRDGAAATPVAIVNRAAARTFWGNESPVGRRVRPGGNNQPWRTVVGVVDDVKNAGLDRPAGTELYLPMPQFNFRLTANILVRADDLDKIQPLIRREVREIDAAVPVSTLRPMDDVVAAARARPRFLSVLLTLFSALAVLLAAVGIYGVLSYSVAQRTNEIGIRMAMGATSSDVLALVLKQGLTTGLIGTAIGAAGSIALARLMQGLLFGVSSLDAATFVAMAALLLIITLLACWLPARRASNVDPIIALRYE